MAAMTDDSIRVRWMIRRDMERVLEIETASFEYPWNERELIDYLQRRNSIGMVADDSDEVVGYMLYDLQKGFIKLDSIAVHHKYRRSGVGSILLDKLKTRLGGTFKRTRIETMIRESNLSGLSFFRANGFEAVELLRDPYPHGQSEDAYRLEYQQGPRRMRLRNRITAA